MTFETTRVLIWGKTYPELSRQYVETVCTAGVREDGQPVRLYPVPLRYLESQDPYKLYDWIEVPMAKSAKDSRPESFKVNSQAIRRVGHVDPDDLGWYARRALVFKDPGWQFGSVGALAAAERERGCSLGIVTPGQVDEVRLERKPPEAAREHAEKAAELQAQRDAFLPEYKELGFRDHHIKLRWRCGEPCPTCARQPHDMQVLDWGLIELARKKGWDWAQAKARLEDIVGSGAYDTKLFLGNTKAHRKNFLVVGLWYPKRQAQGSLF